MVMRKLAIIPIPEAKPVSLIEVPADSVVFGFSKSQPFGLVVGAAEGSAPIKRRLWIIGVGGDISAEAQNGDFLGDAYLPMAEEPGNLVLVLGFIETQKQAIDRAKHYGGRPTANP
jgi:hypothetical protein